MRPSGAGIEDQLEQAIKDLEEANPEAAKKAKEAPEDDDTDWSDEEDEDYDPAEEEEEDGDPF